MLADLACFVKHLQLLKEELQLIKSAFCQLNYQGPDWEKHSLKVIYEIDFVRSLQDHT